MTLLRLRLLTGADLAFADSVRALAGWNQTLADWQRFLALEPDGCFLAEWDGVPAGTATTMTYGRELAWIGMVLVHPDYRRRGLGRALLEHCVAHLRERGVRCIKLDATPDGEKVYAGLGFQAEWTLTRWERAGAPRHEPPIPRDGVRGRRGTGLNATDNSECLSPHPNPLPQGEGESHSACQPGRTGPDPTGARRSGERIGCPTPSPWGEGGGEGEETAIHSRAGLGPQGVCGSGVHGVIRSCEPCDAPAIEAFDASAFGVSRSRLIEALAEQAIIKLLWETVPSEVSGYGLARPGSRASYLGPVAAVSAEVGVRLVEALLAGCPQDRIFWDIPDANTAAVAWASEHGFTRQRPLTRMFLGENRVPGEPQMQFAIAGPEVG